MLKEKIKDVVSRLAGTKRLQEEINTAFYFLNEFHDIRSVPRAEGDIRNLQRCATETLCLFDELCRANNLEYWLDFGTLLGAIRHKGFIPWDDDLDVAMERLHWNRAAQILPPILNKMGFYVQVYSESWFGFGYDRDNTGLWMDVFCYERYQSNDNPVKANSILKKCIKKQLSFAHKKKTFNVKPTISRREMRANRSKQIYFEESIGEGRSYFFLSPEIESNLSLNILTYEDIYPLILLEFEGSRFFAPQRSEKILSLYYGDYLKFPKNGVLHHNIQGVGLADIASSSGTDMQQIEALIRSLRIELSIGQ